MKAPKPLKDLPGFDEALASAMHGKHDLPHYDFAQVGDAVIPGLTRVGPSMLENIAMYIGMDRFDAQRAAEDRDLSRGINERDPAVPSLRA